MLYSEKALKDIVRVVQIYSAENPNTKVKIPKFGSIGLQSSGKTQLAAVIAGRYIGGSIKGGVGTRCKIVYIFKNSADETFEVGQDLNNLEMVSPNDITARVTAHNDAIASIGTGFSTETYYVRISTPDTIDFVVIDKPGLLPDEADINNEHVKQILLLELEGEDLIPIIMIRPHSALDSEYLKTDLKRIFSACGGGMHMHTMRKAYVIFTALDNLKGNDINKFVTFRDTVISEFKSQCSCTLPKDRIFFVSLKPHLLDPHTKKKSFDSNHKKFHYDKENDIIMEAKSDSATYLPAFLLHTLGSGWEQEVRNNELNFGLEPALAAIENELVSYVKRNYQTIVGQIKADGRALAKRVKATLTPILDKDKIIREVQEYVYLVCSGLEATANTKPAHFREALERANASGWPIKTPISVSLGNDLCMTLEDDLQEAEATIGPISFAAPEVIDKINKASELFESLDATYSASRAVERILSLLKFYVMSTELPEYSADIIWNKMGFVGEGKVESIINACIQKMVEEKRVHFPTEEAVAWAADIYKRMLPRVLAALRDENVSQLLVRYPKVHQHVDNALQVVYRNHFDNITKKAVASIADVKKNQFATLGISKVNSLIKLLGASNTAAIKALVQPSTKPATTEPSYFANLKAIPIMSKLFSYIPLADTLLGAVTGGGDRKGSADENASYPYSFEFIGHLTSCSKEEYAVGEQINVRQFGSKREVEENLKEINALVHAITHLSIGLTSLELVEIVKSAIIVPAMHEISEVRQTVLSVVNHLQDNDYAELTNLLEDDDNRLQSLQGEINSITSWLQIATQLNDPATNELGPRIDDLKGLKLKLEALYYREEARISAKIALAPPTTDDDSVFIDDEDDDNDEDVGATTAKTALDYRKEKEEVTRELANLKNKYLEVRELLKARDKEVMTLKDMLSSKSQVSKSAPSNSLDLRSSTAVHTKGDVAPVKAPVAEAPVAKAPVAEAPVAK